MSDELARDKQRIRSVIRQARREMTTQVRARDNAVIRAAIRDKVSELRPDVVAAYAPMETEPGGGELVAMLADLTPTLLLPVASPSLAMPALDWVTYDPNAGMTPGRWPEPVGPRLGPDAVRDASLVIAPALAVDQHGVRLGRGGGHYDVALTYVSGPVVALLYDAEFVETVPCEPHDQRVSAVVTPKLGWREL